MQTQLNTTKSMRISAGKRRVSLGHSAPVQTRAGQQLTKSAAIVTEHGHWTWLGGGDYTSYHQKSM